MIALGKDNMVLGRKRGERFGRGVDGIIIEQDGPTQINYQMLAGLHAIVRLDKKCFVKLSIFRTSLLSSANRIMSKVVSLNS